jgi:hypothetical protein
MRKWDEMQVKFSWVQLHRRQEQRSCGMLLFSTDYLDQVLFFLQGSLAKPCFPLAVSVPISQEALDIAVLMSRLSSTASVSHILFFLYGLLILDISYK